MRMHWLSKQSHKSSDSAERLVNTMATLTIALSVFVLALFSAPLQNASAQADRLVINGDGSTFAYPMYKNGSKSTRRKALPYI